MPSSQRRISFWSAAALAGCLFQTASCDNGPSAPKVNPQVLAVRVAPRDITIPVGTSVNMVAVVDVEGGAPTTVSWSVSDQQTASISEDGELLGLKQGSVAVTATSTFNTSRKDIVTIHVEQVSNVPATVFIQAINRGGTSFPVDPGAASGVVDAILTVNPGDQVVTRIDLLVDAEVVQSQLLGLAAPVSDDPAALSEPFTVTMSFNTAAFEESTGAPNFLNGPHAIIARLTTLSGDASGTAATQLTFANQNRALALVTTNGAVALDGAGRSWRSGDLVVQVRAVIFTSASITLASAVVEFPGLEVKNTTTGSVSWPRSSTIAAGGSLSYSNNGTTGLNAPVLLGSILSDGSPGPQGPFANASAIGIRLDNRAPTPGALRLTDQSATRGCCAGGWVGADYLFSNGHSPSPFDGENIDGVGIAPNGVTYHVGSPSASDEQIIALPAVARGSDLAESAANDAYVVVARIADRLGNLTHMRLAPSSDNPISTFGVDRGAPSFTFSGIAGVADGAVNPASPAFFVTVPFDTRSGLTATPVAQRIFGNFSNSSCFVGTVPQCMPILGGLQALVPEADGMYYTYEAFAIDRAGNRSATISRTILVDHEAPSVQALPLPPQLVGGASTQFSFTVADNVDLFSVQHRLEFPSFSGVQASLPFAQSLVFDVFGAPLTTLSSALVSVSFVRSIESSTPADAPSGSLESATGSRFTVLDRALNTSSAAVAFPPGSVAPGISFGSIPGLQFRLTSPAPGATVCNGIACAGVPQSRSIIAEASGPGLNNPFARGVHFFWIDNTGTTRLLASGVNPAVFDDGAIRRWTWTVSFTATGLPLQNGVQIFAVGASAQGDGLRTRTNSNLSVIGGG